MRLSACNTEKLNSVVAALKSYEYPTKPTEGHSRAVKAEMVTTKRSYRFVSNAEVQEMLKLYASGLSAKAVGEKVDRNPRTVTDTLRKHGVTNRQRTTSSEDTEKMYRLYDEGLSSAEIARVLGRSRSSVSKHLTKAGITLRRK